MKKIAALIFLWLAAPVAAQDRMTAAQCTESWAAIEMIAPVANGDRPVAPDNESWCLIEGVTLNGVEGQTWLLARLRWRATDIDRFVNDGLPPRALEVLGEGLQIVPDTGDAVLDYVFGLQSENVISGFGMSARWDGLQNAVIVDDAFVTFDANNRVGGTARIEGVNLTDADAMAGSLGTMGLHELTLTMQLGGWFERIAALPLAMTLLRDRTKAPAAQVEALKTQAIDALASLPDATMPAAGRDALGAFIATLPRPRGTARVQVTADPILGAERLAEMAALTGSVGVEGGDAALRGLSILFNWTPAGPGE